MERIWAPWRLSYVSKANKSSNCVFCDLEDEAGDSERKILHRGKYSYVIMNIFPYNNGHLLVVPYKHTSNMDDLSNEEKTEMMTLISEWTKILTTALCCHGFNVGLNLGEVAGAGIADHLHFHIVPRWRGDTNFMPVICDTRVIPQSLEDCYDLLMKTLKEYRNIEKSG